MRVLYKLDFQVELWLCLIRKKNNPNKRSASTQTHVSSPLVFNPCPTEIASQMLQPRATAKQTEHKV